MKKLFFVLLIVTSNCFAQQNIGNYAVANNFTDVKSQIDSLFLAYDFYSRFSGTVLVALKDSIIYHQSFGYADIDKNVKNQNSNVFGLASCSKQFTATAILKLTEEGRIRLDDKLSKYFPELGETTKKISIEHLLCHSSGIANDIGRGDTWSQIIFPSANAISLDSLVHIFGNLKSSFTPGSSFDYNNFNYILLAAIIEKITGKTYNNYLHDTFFTPLQLDYTTYNQLNVEKNVLSKPYADLPNSYTTTPFWDDSWGIGASGIFSNASNIHLWLQKQSNYELVSEQLTNKMYQPLKKDRKEFYGFGWQISTMFGKKYIYHDGGTNGYYCKLSFLPTEKIYVIILSNHTHNLTHIGNTARFIKEVNQQVYNILFQQPYQKLPIATAVSVTNLPKNITIENNQFGIQKTADNNMLIVPQGKNSILDIPYSLQYTENSKRFKKVETVVLALGKRDFKTVLKHNSFLMRTLISEKKFGEIWQDLAGETGELLSWNCYKLADSLSNSYDVRMVYEKKEICLKFHFKRNNLIGMFTDKTFNFNTIKQSKAYVINDSQIFIDGFSTGNADALLKKENNNWYFDVLSKRFQTQVSY